MRMERRQIYFEDGLKENDTCMLPGGTSKLVLIEDGHASIAFDSFTQKMILREPVITQFGLKFYRYVEIKPVDVKVVMGPRDTRGIGNGMTIWPQTNTDLSKLEQMEGRTFRLIEVVE